ncbi:LacI family DNA-binding transcriptional regulator [Nesterenkonia sp. PF2B19]|uniref:LacI family DNA-binding transcriptional regulator n=1 Tax=unclassified Nesterenkonia TaxID=2629769 RepID=UPI0008725AD5|nr:LacI family DNA-binding transcriptional regulator [Nesterenkonia sp. PF2B19]OSM44019.1 LacI family transcriptional regulator [Nesterenkonia sp. PF2B19]
MADDAKRVRPPTIYDVAERAGVAPSTVSRALARPGRVSTQTADKVRRAAEALGYGRRPPSPGLTALPTRLLAIVVADIANPVFHDVIRGAEAAAEEAGYTVILFDAQESDERERRAAEQFLPAVDGLVLTSPRLSDAGIHAIAKQRPLITLNRQVRGLPSVLTDSARGTRRAAEHLGAHGHDSLAYVAGPEASWTDGMRWRGAQEAGIDLDIRTRRIGPGVPTVAGGEQAARAWAEAPTTGVICYNDIMAVGFIRRLQATGLDVPTDVSVIGFDNSRIGLLTTPALTSVASPLQHQGEMAVKNLIAIINGAISSEEPVLLPTKLVERSSSGPASGRPPSA